MASNSIRVDAALFGAAQAEGTVMSRSAAQQIEHWARIGAALEATALSVTDVSALLRNGGCAGTNASDDTGGPALWAFKRQRQSRDLQAVTEGRVDAEQMSWFAGGKARKAKLVGSPY